VRNSRLFWQLYGAFATLIISTVLVFGLLTISQIQKQNAEENRASLEIKAKVIRSIALPYLTAEQRLPDTELNKLSSIMGNRITVITAGGRVLSDSESDPEIMDNHNNRPEIQQARSRGIGTSERFSQTLQKDMRYLALRIDEQSVNKGYVRVSIPQASINENIYQFRDGILMSALVVGALALMFSYLIATRLSRPLVRMTEVAKSMADGDYSQRLPQSTNNEIGELSQALNQLASSSLTRLSTIAEEKNQLAAILGGLVEGVIAITDDQRIIHINEAASRMLNLPPMQPGGRLIWEVLRNSELIRAIEAALQGEELVQTRLRYGGTTINLAVVQLRDADNEISGAIIVLHDVTAVELLEDIKADFVANASHELKTPIAAIRGMVETIMENQDMAVDDRQRFTTRIHKQTLRLGSIVGDLLTLSRFDSSVVSFDSEEIDMSAILSRELESSIVQIATEHGVSLVTEFGEGSMLVNGDENALVQLVNNLTDNAIKYTKPGGHVEVKLTRDHDWVLLSVTDDGIGISRQEQQRVFERFYRVDKARSTELGGTGLGLSIVKHIVLVHGGDISLQSELDVGSVFLVRLPVAGHG
jgi:two-component system phosphate regulon sensor histidine kinase PhoR